MVFRWKVQLHGLRKTLPLACKHVDLIVPCDLKGAIEEESGGQEKEV